MDRLLVPGKSWSNFPLWLLLFPGRAIVLQGPHRSAVAGYHPVVDTRQAAGDRPPAVVEDTFPAVVDMAFAAEGRGPAAVAADNNRAVGFRIEAAEERGRNAVDRLQVAEGFDAAE